MIAANLPDVFSTDPDIGRMAYAACAGRVERALRAVPGVTEADVNLATERACVQGSTVSDALIAIATTAGYQARVATDETATLTAVEPDFWEGAGPVCIAATLSVPPILLMIAGWFSVDWMLPLWV